MSSNSQDCPAPDALPPSSKLLCAALAGLLAVSVTACADDDAGSPQITSSHQVESLDADGFKALCDARAGVVEVIAHCGGLASGRGFAYDSTIDELSEHTCKGANTCAGWNCLTD